MIRWQVQVCCDLTASYGRPPNTLFRQTQRQLGPVGGISGRAVIHFH